jgi:hypothetical protein
LPSDAPHHPPGTIEHFAAWAELLILDNGQPYVLQPYELEIFRDVLAGYREILASCRPALQDDDVRRFALYHCSSRRRAVPIGASAKEQAAIIYEQAAGFVRRSAGPAEALQGAGRLPRIVGTRTAGR